LNGYRPDTAGQIRRAPGGHEQPECDVIGFDEEFDPLRFENIKQGQDRR